MSPMPDRQTLYRLLQMAGLALLAAVAFVWSTPLIWMLTASVKQDARGGMDMASLMPSLPIVTDHFSDAWSFATFPLFYFNTAVLVLGILAVQCATITLAGYAFARLRFAGRDFLFILFLIQLMLAPPLLIVPNLSIITRLGLYDNIAGIMAPYWASAFGTFLMRQTFKTIPLAYEEAAVMDGAGWWRILFDVLVPLARPGLIAFSIISVTSHWNEFLWPLMVINSPQKQVLTVGLASFIQGAEGASDWGLIAAGTCLVAIPLLVAFVAFQRQFVSSFMFHGVK